MLFLFQPLTLRYAGALNNPNFVLSETNDCGNVDEMLHSAYISWITVTDMNYYLW